VGRDDGGGGATGRIWRKHGRGFYALLAVGTFIYLEVTAFLSSAASAQSVQGFMASELTTFMIESVVNTVSASFWPVVWYMRMGTSAVYWVLGGYLLWALLIAIVLNRREKELRKELDL